MAVHFSSKFTSTLYQNRYCEQEDFDIIITENTFVLKHSEERKSFRIDRKTLIKLKKCINQKNIPTQTEQFVKELLLGLFAQNYRFVANLKYGPHSS